MMKNGLLLFLWMLFLQCNNSHQQEETKEVTAVEKDETKNERRTGNNPQFLNNISIRSIGGLVVSRASLVNEEGNLIGPSNTIPANKAVYLQLHIKKGWTIKNGTVSLGAVQTIETNLGEQVVQTGDLFANDPEIKIEKARTIRLKSVITRTRPDISSYTVRFRIWDKRGKAEATGDYQIRLSQ